jgi:NDP-sugar pyrophosphorylase family protein
MHQLRLLQRKGVREVVLCVGHLGEMIQDLAGEGREFGIQIRYSFDGALLLGTAGAIHKALPQLHDQFFVLYGDSYLDCDYMDIADAFAASRKQGLMTIYRNEGKFDTSNIEAENGFILRYDKKIRSPQMHYIDYGLGVFQRSVFEALPADKIYDLADVYQSLLAAKELAAYEVKERFYEIGSTVGIADLEQHLKVGRPC